MQICNKRCGESGNIMSIINHWRWYIGIGALLISSIVSAKCERLNNYVYELNMDMGRVVVSPDLKVGDVIKKESWTLNSGGGAIAYCKRGTKVEAEIATNKLNLWRDGIYQTNVEGIGMKFHRGGEVSMTYPHTFVTPRNANYSLASSKFTLTLVKTAPTTGSGTVASGIYTTYGDKNAPPTFLRTYLSANAITIVSPSCQITSGVNQNVNLDPIKRTQLTGRDTWANETPFSIRLRCNGGVSLSGQANVNLTFSGLNATTTLVNGVLANESPKNAAKGIGIQVVNRNDRSPINFNGKTKYTVAKLINNNDKEIELNFLARYFQHDEFTTAGEVYAKMRFDITYD